MSMTRRTVVLSGIATAAMAALPVSHLLAAAIPEPSLVADMFYTEDEPWGAFVRGHVSKEQFDGAILRMIETNSDHRENGQDWLWESDYSDDDEEVIRVVAAEPSHLYMRVDEIDPERGELHRWCKESDPGAIPITVVRY